MGLSFSEIELTKHEIQLLTDLKNGAAPYRSPEYDYLSRLGLVCFAFRPDSGQSQIVLITDSGYSYLRFYKNRKKEKAHDNWKFRVTTTLTIIALLKSFDQEILSAWAWVTQLFTS